MAEPAAAPAKAPPAAAPVRAGQVAVMQPYFFPYAGYFRLFHATALFVIFDCVQFPRRGRVHRTEVPGPTGSSEWLTLPLAHQPRTVRICELAFAAEARQRLDERLGRHAWLRTANGAAAERIKDHLYGPLTGVVDFLETGLRLTAGLLGFDTPITRSSALGIDPHLRGQERVLAILRAVGARHYVNAPGGRALYRSDAFAQQGLSLSFLTPYRGDFVQLLPALLGGDCAAIRADILRTIRQEAAAEAGGLPAGAAVAG